MTAGSVIKPRRSILCALGFHSRLTGRNDRDEQVFLCRRCGRVSPDDEETEVYWSAYRYGGHDKPEVPE